MSIYTLMMTKSCLNVQIQFFLQKSNQLHGRYLHSFYEYFLTFKNCVSLVRVSIFMIRSYLFTIFRLKIEKFFIEPLFARTTVDINWFPMHVDQPHHLFFIHLCLGPSPNLHVQTILI